MLDLENHVEIENHGSIFLLRPISDEAKTEMRVYASGPENQWLGDALAVESSYIDDFLYALAHNIGAV